MKTGLMIPSRLLLTSLMLAIALGSMGAIAQAMERSVQVDNGSYFESDLLLAQSLDDEGEGDDVSDDSSDDTSSNESDTDFDNNNDDDGFDPDDE